MAANEDSLFGRLTKAIVDRVVGSFSERLTKLGRQIMTPRSDGPQTTGLIGRIARRQSQQRDGGNGHEMEADNQRRMNAARARQASSGIDITFKAEPKGGATRRVSNPVASPAATSSAANPAATSTASPGLFNRAVTTIQKTATGAKNALDSAIMKAESWITSAPQRMRATLTAPSSKRKGPLSTPGARRLRTKRVRGLMLGRSKQAWGWLKRIRAERRSIAQQHRSGSLPNDLGQLEKQSLSSIVSAEKSKQSRASWFERTVNERGQVVSRGRLVNLAKRTGLDFFAKRQNRTRAAGLVKRAKVRLNNARRRVAKASGAATPQMRAAVTSAAGRLAQAQGMLAKTTMLASGSLGQLAKTGVGAITALHAFPYAMKKLGESRVEQLREASQYSSRLMTAMARYDIQDRQLTMRGAVNTSGSASRTVNATMGLRESLQGPLEDLASITNTGVTAAVNSATTLNEIMKAWNPIMIGLHWLAKEIEENTDKENDTEVTASLFFRNADRANDKHQPLKTLPPIK